MGRPEAQPNYTDPHFKTRKIMLYGRTATQDFPLAVACSAKKGKSCFRPNTYSLIL
jgi:hypothetical protein